MPQAEQDPMAMAGSQAQSFFQYLHQQKSLFQQRQQQTADLLSLLSQSCSTESTSGHPLLNIPSDSPASTSAPQHTSPVRSKLLPDADHWLSAQQNSNSLQFEHEEDELIDDDKDDDSDPGESTFRPFLEDMPTRSDFVNKLYKRVASIPFLSFCMTDFAFTECSPMKGSNLSCVGDLKEIVSSSRSASYPITLLLFEQLVDEARLVSSRTWKHAQNTSCHDYLNIQISLLLFVN